ncbi:MAG: hypothetical protein K1Y36_09970 [Blastocatellia bacterium]|nr:hypothetical protein [Blastocatellia bacterium]
MKQLFTIPQIRMALALIFCVLLGSVSVPPAVRADKEIRPVDVVIACLDAFFKNDEQRIRASLTDNAQTVLASLATTDAAAYDDIRKALAVGNPLSKIAENNVRMEVVTAATGERKGLLQAGNKILGTVNFAETTEENLSLVEVRLTQTEDAAPLLYQVVLVRNRKKKDKPWQISALYQVAQGGRTDDYFKEDNLTAVRVSNNEKGIVEALRNLASSEARFAIGMGKGKYGTLSELRRAGEIGTDIESGKVKGYVIEIIVNNSDKPPSFSIFATPAQYGKTGRRSFVIDESTTVHGNDRRGDRATANDPEIPAADEAEGNN